MFSKLIYPSLSSMGHHKEILFSLISTCILYFRSGARLSIYNSNRKLKTKKNQIKFKGYTRYTKRVLNPNEHILSGLFWFLVFGFSLVLPVTKTDERFSFFFKVLLCYSYHVLTGSLNSVSLTK